MSLDGEHQEETQVALTELDALNKFWRRVTFILVTIMVIVVAGLAIFAIRAEDTRNKEQIIENTIKCSYGDVTSKNFKTCEQLLKNLRHTKQVIRHNNSMNRMHKRRHHKKKHHHHSSSTSGTKTSPVRRSPSVHKSHGTSPTPQNTGTPSSGNGTPSGGSSSPSTQPAQPASQPQASSPPQSPPPPLVQVNTPDLPPTPADPVVDGAKQTVCNTGVVCIK